MVLTSCSDIAPSSDSRGSADPNAGPGFRTNWRGPLRGTPSGSRSEPRIDRVHSQTDLAVGAAGRRLPISALSDARWAAVIVGQGLAHDESQAVRARRVSRSPAGSRVRPRRGSIPRV